MCKALSKGCVFNVLTEKKFVLSDFVFDNLKKTDNFFYGL